MARYWIDLYRQDYRYRNVTKMAVSVSKQGRNGVILFVGSIVKADKKRIQVLLASLCTWWL